MTEGPYDIGDGLVATVTFDVAGVATDPTTVTAKVRNPAGTVTTYTYSAAPGQPDPHIVRSSAGVYTLTLVPDAAGTWLVQWTGTGAVTAVDDQSYTVVPSAIDAPYVAPLTAVQLAEIRQWIGAATPPTDDDLAVAFARLGSTGDVALEVLRGRYSTAIFDGPGKYSVEGDFSVDGSADRAAMAKLLASLEGTIGAGPVMTVHSLTRADPWR
jgi:hypothetical protein